MSKNNNVFVYSLATQHENLGDLLINKELVCFLNTVATVVIEDKGVPDDFLYSVAGSEAVRASSNVNSFCVKSKGFYLKSLFTKPFIDAVILSPGHLGDSNAKRSLKKFFVLLTVIYLRLRGVKTIRVGVSFGNLSLFASFIESLSALIFSFYAVRDEASKSKLLAFSHNHCVVIPDLSLLAFDYFKNKSQVIASVKNKLVLSFRGDRRYPLSSMQYSNLLYSDIPIKAVKEFDEILCYSQVSFDSDEQSKIQKLLEAVHSNVSFVEECDNLDNAVSYLCDAKVVISNRLHVLLPSLMLSTLAIFVGSKAMDSKIYDIYNDFGLSDLIYDVETCTEDFSVYLSRVLNDNDKYLDIIDTQLQAQSKLLTSLLNKHIN